MAKARIKREKDFENGSVTFTVIETGKSMTVNVNDYSDEIKNKLLVHAVNAKVGDSAADPKEDALAAMVKTHEQLAAGNWSSRGEGTGGAKTTLLLEAMQRVFPDRSEEEIREKLDSMSDEQVADLKKHPQVVEHTAKIRAERAAAKAKKSKAAADATPLEF